MKSLTHYFLCFLVVTCFSQTANSAFADEQEEYEGLIEPSQMVNIGTPVEGVIEQVKVQRSSLVKKGDPLVFLESTVENAVVERARVLAAVQGEIKIQKERLAFAKRVYERVNELFKAEAISAEKRDEAATEVQLAKARLQKAKEDLTIAKLDLERARAVLERRTINSPISGVVVERFVAPGEFVDNQPLLRLAQMDPLRVEVILPLEMFNKITAGMKAEVHPETNSQENYDATVTIVDRVIDPASGTFGVRLELPNPDYRLPGGLKCTVRFTESANISSPQENVNKADNEIIASVRTGK